MINCSKSNWSKSSVPYEFHICFSEQKMIENIFLWKEHFMNVWKIKLRSLLSDENVNDREKFSEINRSSLLFWKK